MKSPLKTSLLSLSIATAAITGLVFEGAGNLEAQEAAQGSAWKYFPASPVAPQGAPNVLVVLTDDVGFSAASGFGGPIPTPAFDSIADDGLRYTRFHVTAMCSPTRASLLTGRNHHAVGYGAISNVAVDEPGYTSVIPDSAATIGNVLGLNGYSTAFFGKNHNTPDWENGPLGPYERWPSAWGFDYFYGFNGPATDQVNPELIENHNPIRRDPTDEDYFLDRDLGDHMVEWLHMQDTLQDDKPFLLYFAPGTMHGPQQAPQEWIEKFKGQFDKGWDMVRAETFERQKVMGIVPAIANMAPLPPGLPTWDSLTDLQKSNYAHLMEVAAAQLAFMDYQFGRVLDALKETGDYDNTLIIYVQGDNGAAIHEINGTLNSYEGFAQIDPTEEELARNMHLAGGEDAFGNYPAGWAYAMNTPFPWGKSIASHLGGTRNGMVVSWPARIHEQGSIRTQYAHVIDIAPTIYEAVGITPPQTVDGVEQQVIDGISIADSFTDPDAPTHRREQYYEMLGTRGFYRDGWLAGTAVTWQPWSLNDYDPNTLPWELYNLDEDFTQTNNVAAEYPAKLEELKAAFDAAAEANNVYPLAADYLARLNPNNRPHAMSDKDSYVFYPGDYRYPIAAWPNVTPNWTATARFTTQSARDNGPVFVMGMRFTGYDLKLEDGVPVFTYNPTGREQERMVVRGRSPLPAGDHVVEVTFRPQANGVRLALAVDGLEVATDNDNRFYRVFAGNALIGRPALDDRTGPRACDCAIEDVTISLR